MSRSVPLQTAGGVEVEVGVELGVAVPVAVGSSSPMVPALHGSPALSSARMTFPPPVDRFVVPDLSGVGRGAPVAPPDAICTR